MNEVREGVRIGSLRRETEGIKKWNQVFDDPVLASKCMDSYFDDSLVAREALLALLESASRLNSLLSLRAVTIIRIDCSSQCERHFL
jgi:hypothetical protein